MDLLIQSFFNFIPEFSFSAYFIVFIVALIESLAFIGLAFPGVVLIVLIGFFSVDGRSSILLLLFYTFCGAAIGDITSYILGTKNSRFLKGKFSKLVTGYIARGEIFMAKHGKKSILFGRFIGPMRPVIPYIAGFLKMNIKDFLLWDIGSTFAWALTYLLLGYYGGKFWQTLNIMPKKIWWFIFYAVLVVFAYYFLKWAARRYGKGAYRFLKSIVKSALTAIGTNPDVQKISDKYPKTSGFIKKRFTRRDYFGLFFTVLTLIFSYLSYLFYNVIRDVYHIDFLVGADVRIANLLFAFRDPLTVNIFMVITLLGKFYVVCLLALIMSIFLWKKRQRIFIFPLWFILLGSASFVSIAKYVFQRPRPLDISVYTESSFSFPSGHSAVSMVFYGFCAYFFWKYYKSNETKLKLLMLAFLIIFFVGFSRVYLGVHFFSDVWGGYILGFMWLIIGMSLTEWFNYKKRGQVPEAKPALKMAFVSFLLIASQLGLFANYFIRYQEPLFGIPETKAEQIIYTSAKPENIFNDHSLHKYSETLSGKPMEPISFTIVAESDESLAGLFQKAGWVLADQVSPESLTRLTWAALKDESYPEAPMTPSFWNAQVHNLGFQKPTAPNTIKERHHARFWKSNIKASDGKSIYVGTASLDIGLKWGITHTISPDIDTEREYIFSDLKNTGLVASWKKVKLVAPVLGKNTSGDQFFTDGEMYVLYAGQID